MIRFFGLAIVALFCVLLPADASIIMFEAGPFAIIMDKDIEKTEIGDLELWPTFGFEPVASRELAKENYYNLKIGSVLADGESGLVSKYPMVVEISEKPIEDEFNFIPEAVKEITVGRIYPINTTLYTGKYNGRTPHFVNFSTDGIYCTVYDPNTSETTITEFLNGFSVIRKEDLGKYNLSMIWSHSISDIK